MSNTGLILRAGNNFTDDSLPVYSPDPILTSGNGSLVLLDVRNWQSGVPTHLQKFTNIAAEKAAALGISGDVSGDFEVIGTMVGSGYGVIERSSKGGLHCIVSNATSFAAYHGFQVRIPDTVLQYMIDNPTHNYYYSQWKQITRAASTTSPDGAKCYMDIEEGNSAGFMRFSHTSAQDAPGSGTRLGFTAPNGRNTVGHNMVATAGPAYGTPAMVNFGSNASKGVAQFGRIGRQNNYPPSAGLPSFVFYRAYIEDLTVSGRSYATVSALDQAMWTTAVNVGGRFYGDTFTAVSTLP